MATEIRHTLLLVDDDPTALKMRAMVLQFEGYDVLPAVSGEEALAIFSTVPVDLVVSDHFLKGESGGALALEMKKLKPAIPFILLSGLPMQPDGTEHVDAYLVKGISILELLEKIKLLLPKCGVERGVFGSETVTD